VCTLTWIRRDSGFELFFNRDERRTRGRALSPRIHERAGRRWIAPIDPDGGGTWIGVNEFGLGLALLNGYRRSDDAERRWTSRGLLVDSLLDALSCREVEVRLRKRDLARFRSFTLVAVEPVSPALLATWDGAELALDHRGEGHPPLCSSSLDSGAATRARRELFHEMAAEHGAIDADLLERFHASHRPERGPWSPCMHRDEAQTHSSTLLRVGARTVELHYSPGAPCEGLPAERIELERASRAVLRP
jgi:hypothetical protein